MHRAGRDRGLSVAAAALIAGGSALRVWQWSLDRSLWIDEATVALGVLIRPFVQQLGTHDFGQISPPGWLALVDLSATAFGPSEMALRLPTLILAICYLPALWFLLTNLVAPRVALFGLALAAVSPSLIKFSSELKPYGADPLVTVGILALFLAVLRGRSPSVVLGAVGGLALGLATWFSSVAIVVIVGCVPALVATKAARRAILSARGLASHGLLVGIPMVFFGFALLVHYRPAPDLAQYVDRFWVLRFWSGGPPGLPGRIWASLMDVVSPVFFGHEGDLFPGIILLLMAFGAWQWLRRCGTEIPLVCGPLLVWAALAVLRLYPVDTRLGLFAAPCLTVLLVSGWQAVGDWCGRRWPRVGRRAPTAALALWLLLPSGEAAMRVNLDGQSNRSNARPAIEAMAMAGQPGEVVYIYARAAPEWLFYTTVWERPDLRRIHQVLDEYRYPDGRTFANAPPRTTATAPVGADLQYRYGGRREIYGIFSGFEQSARRQHPSSIDRDWAEVEADRMLAIDAACLWLVGFHSPAKERDAVRRRLIARGYVHLREIVVAKSRIDLVCRAGR